MAKRLSLKRQRFLDAYFGEAYGNATEAAAQAGFGNKRSSHRTMGSNLLKILSKEIQEREIAEREKMEAGAEEVRQRLTNVARNDQHKDHVRALELLAKIHGMMSDKVTVKVDRSTLEKQLVDLADQIKANPL